MQGCVWPRAVAQLSVPQFGWYMSHVKGPRPDVLCEAECESQRTLVGCITRQQGCTGLSCWVSAVQESLKEITPVQSSQTGSYA